MSFAFARFRDRLKAKAEVNGNTVLIVDESYTSKTANWTGEIVQNLGGAKAITSRGVSLDRDLNAALGILLKALPDRPFAGLPATALKHYLAADSKGK
jgi:putative transposase